MRFHSPLDDICSSRVKIRLLRFLCRTEGSLTGRQLAGFVGYSHTHTIWTLNELEAHGLVKKRRAGNSYLFSINKENAIVSRVLVPAFQVEANLLDDMAERFFEGLGNDLIDVTVFGSVARGEEDDDSDVDLLLVVRDGADVEDLEDMIDRISIDAAREFGCSVMPIVASQSDYRRKIHQKRGFWKDIPKEGIAIGVRGRQGAAVG